MISRTQLVNNYDRATALPIHITYICIYASTNIKIIEYRYAKYKSYTSIIYNKYLNTLF